MKTTLIIDDQVMIRLREEAARRRTTISALVETALRMLLEAQRGPAPELPDLPSFDGEGCLVDLADRDSLYRAMEGR